MAVKIDPHEWTVREQLILASAVQRSGDQNWVSVSRAIKPLIEAEGWPLDHFSQKNCAQQYSTMLDKAGTHKRKRSTEGSTEVAETAGQQIVRELTEKYIKQLNQSLLKAREEYLAVKKQMEQVESGELDSKLPAMWEEMQKDSAAAKAASKHTKPVLSSSAPAKHQDAVKPKEPSAAQTKDAVTTDSISPSKGTMKKKHKVEPGVSIAMETGSDVSVNDPVPAGINPAFTSSALNLSSKLPLSSLTIKKEPITTPTLMEMENPLPHIASSLMAVSPKEEKFSLPMQTPQPSTPGQLTGGEVHVIVQQPNIAALLTDDRKARTPMPAIKPTLVQTPPIEKSVPALVLSGSTPILPNLMQSTVRASAGAVSVLKQPGVAAVSSASAPTISFPLAVTTISLSRTPPSSITLAGPSLGSSALTTVLTSTQSVLAPTSAHSVVITAQSAQASGSKPSVSPLLVSPVNKPSVLASATKHSLPTPTSKLSITSKAVNKPSLSPTTTRQSLLTSPTVASSGLSVSLSATGTSILVPATPPPVSPGRPAPMSSVPVLPTSTTTRPPVIASSQPALTNRPSVVANKPPTTTCAPFTSKLSLSLSKSGSTGRTPVSAPLNSSTGSSISSSPGPTPSMPAGKPKNEASKQQPVAMKSESLLPSLISPMPSVGVASTMSTGKPLKLTTNPPVLYTIAPQAPPTISPVTAPTSGVPPARPAELSALSGTAKSSAAASSVPASSISKPVDTLKNVIKTSSLASTQPPSTRPPTTQPPRTQTPSTQPPPSKRQVASGDTKKEVQLPTSTKPPSATTHQNPVPSAKTSVLSPPPTAVEPVAVATQAGVPVSEPKHISKPAEKIVAASQAQQGDKPPGSENSASKKEPSHKAITSPLTTPIKEKAPPIATPLTSVEYELVTPVVSTPVAKPTQEEEGGEEDMDEETPFRLPARLSRGSVKKQWNTRSRKRKAPFDEGHSVESTDTEDDVISQSTSAVSSPAPSQSMEMDAESLQSHKQWKKAIIIVWRHAAQHKYANLFLHPVREEDAPGYKNVILRPMDLSTIKKNIELGHIKSDIEFQRDMLLMFQNAFMYNNTGHDVYFMAQEMKNDVMENIQDYLATQAQLQLMEEGTPSKVLRSREGRLKESHEEAVFSPAKKRRTRADD